MPSPSLNESLVQAAVLANNAEVVVVREKERDTAKPALMLGNTKFAQKNGLDVTKLRDWSFVHRVVGKDVIIAGHDHRSKAPTDNKRRPNWDRVGTAKAVVDFARQFARRDCVRMKRVWSISLIQSRKHFPIFLNLPNGDAKTGAQIRVRLSCRNSHCSATGCR